MRVAVNFGISNFSLFEVPNYMLSGNFRLFPIVLVNPPSFCKERWNSHVQKLFWLDLQYKNVSEAAKM